MFILPFSVCKSLLISALTQGGKCGHLLRLTCSVLLWGGRNTADRYCWHVCGVLAGYGPHWVCPRSQRRVLSGSTLLRFQGTIQAGPAFRALPRAKPLRFSGSPQGHRLGWASILCSSGLEQVRRPGTWLARCPRWAVRPITSLVPAARFPCCAAGAPSQLCISSGE